MVKNDVNYLAEYLRMDSAESKQALAAVLQMAFGTGGHCD